MLRSSLVVIFSAGLLLTAGVGGALAHVDDRPSAVTPFQDDSGCGAHNDQGGENHDTKCDDPAPGGSGATASGDSIDQPAEADNMTDEQDSGQGQTGDNEGAHQD